MTLDMVAKILRKWGESPVLEWRFAPHRRWKADLGLPARGISVEVEGGAWTNGRHTRGKGYLEDCRKYNCAQLLGLLVIRVSPQEVESGMVLQLLEAALSVQDAPGGTIGEEEARLLFPAPGRRLRAARGQRSARGTGKKTSKTCKNYDPYYGECRSGDGKRPACGHGFGEGRGDSFA